MYHRYGVVPTFKKEETLMSRAKQSMDGNQAAAHVAYAFTEVAGNLSYHTFKSNG